MRLIDQYPRYASVVLDTNQARILVFGLRTIEKRTEVKGIKTRRNSMGGWSQARYQRRAENFHLHHVKEVVETVRRVSGKDFKVRFVPRRPGDPASIVANVDKIRDQLGWRPAFDKLDAIVAQALAWERYLIAKAA